MSFTAQARAEAPFFRESADADGLEDALRNAVRLNKMSMENLHGAISICVAALRADGMQCEAALLTMKACVNHMARNRAGINSRGFQYPEPLMEQIVRWSISEFYRNE